jgi:hypothetical protein
LGIGFATLSVNRRQQQRLILVESVVAKLALRVLKQELKQQQQPELQRDLESEPEPEPERERERTRILEINSVSESFVKFYLDLSAGSESCWLSCPRISTRTRFFHYRRERCKTFNCNGLPIFNTRNN